MKTLASITLLLLSATANAAVINFDFEGICTNIRNVTHVDPLRTEGFQTSVDIHATFDTETLELAILTLVYYSMPSFDENPDPLLSFSPATATLERLERISGPHFVGSVDLVDQFGFGETLRFRVTRTDLPDDRVHDTINTTIGTRFHELQFDPFNSAREFWQIAHFTFAAAIPEPGAIALALLGLVLSASIRRGPKRSM